MSERIGWGYLAASAARHHLSRFEDLAREARRGVIPAVPASALQAVGARYQLVEPARPVHLEVPRELDAADRRALHLRNASSVPEQFVLDVAGVVVRGRDGWIFHEGRLVEDVWQEAGHSARAMAPLRHRPVTAHLAGTTVSLLQPWSPNYYHWTVQVLPRLLVVLEWLGARAEEADHWLLPPRAPAVACEWLDALGVPESRRVVVPDRQVSISVDRLVVASVPGRNRWVPSWVVDRLRAAAPVDPTRRRGSRLLIQRPVDRRRNLVNAAEVLAALEPLGYEVVDPGSMSLAEEAAVFGAAEVVVGVHGAGLTNMVFCRPGTAVVELTPHALVHPTFVKLADAARVRHRMVVGREPRLPWPLRFPDIHADVVADVPRLLAVLEELAGGSPISGLSQSPNSG
ncbi:glycosyltransferase family 61 protein [Kineococcus sp. SYSU DK003]|uniref:glycosyltransferase family 61 protein n=1 Tax=Kineococcus sp. SYSU DK003 TaxID=3383124 RepID=UPI003D7C9239